MGLQMHRPALQPVPVRWHLPVLKPQPVPLPAKALVCGMDVGFTPAFRGLGDFEVERRNISLPISQLPQPAQAPVCASLPSGSALREPGRDAFVSLSLLECPSVTYGVQPQGLGVPLGVAITTALSPCFILTMETSPSSMPFFLPL